MDAKAFPKMTTFLISALVGGIVGFATVRLILFLKRRHFDSQMEALREEADKRKHAAYSAALSPTPRGTERSAGSSLPFKKPELPPFEAQPEPEAGARYIGKSAAGQEAYERARRGEV